jgi:hypothetical protein
MAVTHTLLIEKRRVAPAHTHPAGAHSPSLLNLIYLAPFNKERDRVTVTHAPRERETPFEFISRPGRLLTICPEDKHFLRAFVSLCYLCSFESNKTPDPLIYCLPRSLSPRRSREQSKDCLLLRPVHLHYWPPPHSITNPRVARTSLCFLQAHGKNFHKKPSQ